MNAYMLVLPLVLVFFPYPLVRVGFVVPSGGGVVALEDGLELRLSHSRVGGRRVSGVDGRRRGRAGSQTILSLTHYSPRGET